MKEHKLFHIHIKPKDGNPNIDVYDFRIVAEDPIEALAKMMNIPDISYMYSETSDEISIQYEGIVY
ncbi:MAG: hypothetical protein IJQ79_07385 [Bacteroidales bacterium]|jgi:uncharacterized protein (DUF849 family)|nr:hypothetical protein [Bacteroidales bacterium]